MTDVVDVVRELVAAHHQRSATRCERIHAERMARELRRELEARFDSTTERYRALLALLPMLAREEQRMVLEHLRDLREDELEFVAARTRR